MRTAHGTYAPFRLSSALKDNTVKGYSVNDFSEWIQSMRPTTKMACNRTIGTPT
jgi:hypothetical protein